MYEMKGGATTSRKTYLHNGSYAVALDLLPLISLVGRLLRVSLVVNIRRAGGYARSMRSFMVINIMVERKRIGKMANK